MSTFTSTKSRYRKEKRWFLQFPRLTPPAASTLDYWGNICFQELVQCQIVLILASSRRISFKIQTEKLFCPPSPLWKCHRGHEQSIFQQHALQWTLAPRRQRFLRFLDQISMWTTSSSRWTFSTDTTALIQITRAVGGPSVVAMVMLLLTMGTEMIPSTINI